MAFTFNAQTGTANPFNGIDPDSYSAPTFADLDGDGDLDAIVGNVFGVLNYYKNTGSATTPVYTQQTGVTNPFNVIDVGIKSKPTLADLDGDGDPDAIVGKPDGTLNYYKNTGGATTPIYVQQIGAANPFNGINEGSSSAPTLADLDGDGDLDAIVGENSGTLNYYKNTGGATTPIYQQIGSNPFSGIDVRLRSTPTFADLDGDGDLDAIVGESDGTLNYYKNTGKATTPIYAKQTGTANPFSVINVGSSSAPTFADLDGDGDLDAVVGMRVRMLAYYKNTDSATIPVYAERIGTANPFNGIDVGASSTPTLADLDGDGDLDAIVGESDGTLNYYQNTGTATPPIYTQQIGAANPFNGIDVGLSSAPTLADLDGDGDLDVIVGDSFGTLKYYKNTGSATPPLYAQQTGMTNPFNGIDVGSRSTPTFADLDGDGDLDAIVGENSGTLKYYRNTGTATTPIYSEQTGAANPFNGIDVGSRSTPTLADLDGDGDLDAIVGENSGTLKYYKNTGSATTPVYAERIGTANPFNGIDVGASSTPTLADLDGDGDLDAIVGESDGTLNYFYNEATTETDVTLTLGTLQITDVAGGTSNDALTLIASSGTLTITDATLELGAGAGTVQVNATTVQALLAAITQPTSIKTLAGNDSVNGATLTTALTIDGGSGQDTLRGGSGRDAITSGTENDSLQGNGGNDTLRGGVGADTLDGGTGTVDIVEYSDSSAGVTVNLRTGIGTGGDAAGDLISNVERVYGSNFADLLTGDIRADYLLGRSGNDTLLGGVSNNVLAGGDGNDILRGGVGADTLNGETGAADIVEYLDSSAGVAVNLITGIGTGGDATRDVISNVERVYGSNFADRLTGDILGNYLLGRNGNDVLLGGESNDVLLGGDGNDTLAGSADNDILRGGVGADLILGGTGADRIDVPVLSESLLSGFDRIQTLEIGVDRINGPTAVSASALLELGNVASLSEASLQVVLTSGNFAANGAATFTLAAGSRTFLALNNGVAGFLSPSDAIVEITGFTGALTQLAII
jgi:hypothetical protein